MIALEQMKSILDDTGIPVCYYAWPEGKAPTLPYISFLHVFVTTV